MADIGRVKIRIPQNVAKGTVVKVRCLIIHPMESIQRDKDGKVVEKAYNFIHSVVATFNGKEVFRAETTQSVSENPFFAFPVKVDAPGTLKVTFLDTSGGKYEGMAEIKF